MCLELLQSPLHPWGGGSSERTHASTCVSLAPPSLEHGGPSAGSGRCDTGQCSRTTKAAHSSLQARETLAHADTGQDSLSKSSHPCSVRHYGPTYPKGHQRPISEQA